MVLERKSICHLWLCSDCKVQFMSLQSPFTWILISFRSSATIEGRPDTVFCEIGNLALKLTNLKPRQWFATIIYFNTWSIIHIPKIDFGTFFQKDKLNFPIFFVCVFSLSLWNKFFLISFVCVKEEHAWFLNVGKWFEIERGNPLGYQ